MRNRSSRSDFARNALAVKIGSMAAFPILKEVSVLTLNDTSMATRNPVIQQDQIIISLAAEGEWSARDFHFTIIAGGVDDDQTW